MSSPENQQEQSPEIKDNRIFDADGNIREDKIKEEVAEEPLTLESLQQRIDILERQTAQGFEQTDVTFTQVGTEMSHLADQIRTTISDMHVRLGVLEEININPDLADDRTAIAAGTFTLDRFKEIAEEIVIPDMKVKAEAARKQMQDRFNRIQAAIQEGLSPEDAMKRVEAEDSEEKNNKGIQIVSG